MITFPKATVVLCKCDESKKIYGVRFEQHGEKWRYNWSFRLKEETAKREKYDETTLIGEIERDIDYPGCPYCGVGYFIVCSNCAKLNCSRRNEEIFTCQWCGTKGYLDRYLGDGIKSEGDR